MGYSHYSQWAKLAATNLTGPLECDDVQSGSKFCPKAFSLPGYQGQLRGCAQDWTQAGQLHAYGTRCFSIIVE